MRLGTHATVLALAGAVLVSACADDKTSDKGPAPTAGSAPTAPQVKRDAAPTAVEVPQEHRGPQVTLSLLGRYKDPAFGAAGLPALSADGKQIAYTEELLDGGRGNPNLRFIIRQVTTDRPVKKIEALAPSPRWSAEDEPLVRGRLDAINEMLAAGSWEAMRPSTFEDDLGPEPVLVIGDLEITIGGDALVVRRSGRRALTRPLSSLLGRNPEPSCKFSPQVAEAYALETALLIRIGFAGQEGCFRESEYHALTLR